MHVGALIHFFYITCFTAIFEQMFLTSVVQCLPLCVLRLRHTAPQGFAHYFLLRPIDVLGAWRL